MLKKDKVENANGGNKEILELLQTSLAQQQKINVEILERLEEAESKGMSKAALLRMVNLLYDTDDKHLSELTRIPLGAVEPLALGTMLDALSDPKVRSGEVSLVQVLYNAYYRLMRSVGGLHLSKGVTLAEEQAAGEAERGAEVDLGADV